MANWLRENSVLTVLGNKLLSYAIAGLATLDFTRVVVRETVSTASANVDYTLADITNASIKQSGRLLHFQGGIENPDTHDYDTTLITARFSNEELGENVTFKIRQIVLLARLRDIDTAAMAAYDPNFVDPGEVPFIVAQSEGENDYDLMPKRSESPTSFDYNLYVVHTGTASITVSITTTGYVSEATFNLTVQDIYAALQNVLANAIGRSAKDTTFNLWSPHYTYGTSAGGSATVSWSRSASSVPARTGWQDGEYFNAYGTFNLSSVTYREQIATGKWTHVEGYKNLCMGYASHVEGEDNYCGCDESSVIQHYADHSHVEGYQNSAFDGECQHIMGRRNQSSGELSVVFGEGNQNDADSSVVGGSFNSNSVTDSFIFGDGNELQPGGSSLVIFGSDNSSMGIYQDPTLAPYETTFPPRHDLVVGTENIIYGAQCSLILGDENSATACRWSAIIGQSNAMNLGGDSLIVGRDNEVNKSYSITVGGKSTEVYQSEYSAVFGDGNVLSSNNCSIVVGYQNQAVGSSYSIISGYTNSATQSDRCIIGGQQNSTNNTSFSLITGQSNTANFDSKIILSGNTNSAYHTDDAIICGANNSLDNVSGSIVAGYMITANFGVSRSVLCGSSNTVSKEVFDVSRNSSVTGSSNRYTDIADSLVGGSTNTAQYIKSSIVIGTTNSVVCATYEGTKSYSRGISDSIIAGSGNTVAQTERSIIFGSGNNIKDYQPHGVPSEFSQTTNIIVGGSANTVTGAYSTIISGVRNTASNIHDSLIVGYDNTVDGLDTNIALTNCVFVSGRDNAVENHTTPQTVFGTGNNVTGNNSLTSGVYLVSSSDASTTLGKYNVADTTNTYSLVIGGGTGDSNRLNIFTVDWSGVVRASDLYIGSSASSVDTRIAELENQLAGLEEILMELRGVREEEEPET